MFEKKSQFVSCVTGLVLINLLGVVSAQSQRIGEGPNLSRHLDQKQIDGGEVSLEELISHGREIFLAKFNRFDGQGRPGATGAGDSRIPNQPAFTRISGPDANSCFGCHSEPRVGGGGEFATSVFVLAQTLDPVASSVDPQFSNERNSLGMMGAGPIEMLAREMTSELVAIREQAKADAKKSNAPVTRGLIAKGISFGRITVLPDGKVDPKDIEGVDWDLIVKPFHQKGAVVSLREFSNNAMTHHHGMQPVERFGKNRDQDCDGVEDELSIGDITALAIFQASLNTPGQLLPRDLARRSAARKGRELFQSIGCTNCHIPAIKLNRTVFEEPNPYNPTGNLLPAHIAKSFSFDMSKEGPKPRLEPVQGGGAWVRAFTDLKRHNLNDETLKHFSNEKVPQANLLGFAPASDFTIPPAPRPTNQFLTRKLWDVGNSMPFGHRGDLTTMTEAIYFHGGEARSVRNAFFALPKDDQAAVVEFLKSLQILPDGSAPVMLEEETQGTKRNSELMSSMGQ